MTIITTTKQMRAREENDFYPTPYELCVASMKLLPVAFMPKYVLDPGAGSGVWGEAAIKYFSAFNQEITGVEFRDVPNPRYYTHWHKEQDFRLFRPPVVYDLVIGNPPYKYAEQFVRCAFAMMGLGSRMIFLLRLAFLEGQERGGKLWRDYPPQSVHVLSKRPSFMPKGHDKEDKTDATAYAIYVWEKGWQGETKLNWLKW